MVKAGKYAKRKLKKYLKSGEPMPAKNQFKRTKDELLAELRRVARKTRRPTVTIREFKQHSRHSLSCYKRRFGTWNRALAAAGLRTGLVTRRNPIDPAEELCRIATHYVKRKGKKENITTGRPLHFGRKLGFRGILYEPQSEHAVIHLFGTVSEKMGYRIEKIRHAYPDCIALRKVPGGRGAWERVRVEFELRSSNFRLHKHDPAYCDAIICWEHDWEDSPLEVIELKRVVEALTAER
ncbi:MAG: hypothetical protein DRP79_09965 [Planctomycetota bacterium]|nr:MAG: hypothetical protein DRP79_09965 [Planctomycetota bacterium]